MRSSRAPATKTTPLPAPRSAPENRDRLAQEGAVQDAIHTPGEYANDLIAESDFPTGDVDGDSEAVFAWKDHNKADIMAPVHRTPWNDAPADSRQSCPRNCFACAGFLERPRFTPGSLPLSGPTEAILNAGKQIFAKIKIFSP
ncbi:MAG: hypothetical protein WBP18_20250 [Paracoccaceae bacterium]